MEHSGQSNISRGLAKKLLEYSPFILCVLIMLPRLLHANFGLLDDGDTLYKASNFLRGDWSELIEIGPGRTRPVYWLILTLMYLIAGANPIKFYLILLIMFLASIWLLMDFTKSLGLNKLTTILVGLFFAVSGPIWESYYTLSKPETMLVLLLTATFAMWGKTFNTNHSRGKNLFILLAMSSMLLATILVKEIVVIILPISVIWLFVNWMKRGEPQGKVSTHSLRLLVLAGLISTVLFALFRLLGVGIVLAEQGYSGNYQFTLARILDTSLRWITWLARDYLYLVPVAISWFVLVVRKRAQTSHIILASLIWMAGWLAIYLPWKSPAEYYLLPFALGGAVLSGCITAEVITALQERIKGFQAVGITSMVAMFLAILLMTLNNISNARFQLTVDTSNAEMMRILADEAPEQTEIYVNIQVYHEYIRQMQRQMALVYDRPDIAFLFFDFQPEINDDQYQHPIAIISPLMENLPALKMRGPLGLYNDLDEWRHSLQEFLAPAWDASARRLVLNSFNMSTIDYPRLFCRISPDNWYCREPFPIIDRREFSYGWEILLQTDSR